MEGFAAIEERLRSLSERVTANHDSVGSLRGKQANQQVEIAVIHTELSGAREDIAELKNYVEDQLKWVRRGLWAAAATFTMFIVSFGALIIQLSR